MCRVRARRLIVGIAGDRLRRLMEFNALLDEEHDDYEKDEENDENATGNARHEILNIVHERRLFDRFRRRREREDFLLRFQFLFHWCGEISTEILFVVLKAEGITRGRFQFFEKKVVFTGVQVE